MWQIRGEVGSESFEEARKRIGAVFVSAIFGLPLLAMTAGVAAAGTVTPIDQSAVSRVGTVVPLDPSGSEIAFSATTSTGKYLGDAVYVANTDGSQMRRVGGSDAAIYGITATDDKKWLAYQSPGFIDDFGAVVNSSRVGLINVATGVLHHAIGIPVVASIIGGPAWFYAIPETGRAIRIDPATGAKHPVRLTGSGASIHPNAEKWKLSDDLRQAGFCSALTTRGTSTRRIIGLLNHSTSVVTTISAPLQGWSSCQIADDGSTVATIGVNRNAAVLLALRHRTRRLVALGPGTLTGSGVQTVVGLSPSGRYALVATGDPVDGAAGAITLVDIDHQRRWRLAGINGLRGFDREGFSAAAAWSHTEQTVVLVAASWQNHGQPNGAAAARLVAVSTQSGQVHALARLVAPAGMPFDGTPVPEAMTDDGKSVGVAVPTASATTDQVPYRVPLNGTGATLLFTSSVRSFNSLTRSPDGSHAWIAAGWTCHSSYRFPMMSMSNEDPWATPWQTG